MDNTILPFLVINNFKIPLAHVKQITPIECFPFKNVKRESKDNEII